MSKPYYRYRTTFGLEVAIYEEQEKFIKEKFGARAADKANYGYGVGGGEDCTSVCTKVYVVPTRYIQTNASIGDCRNDFVHEIQT